MNGIDKIIARMEADTQAECADIAAQAAAEAEAILAQYRAEADKLLREGEARCKVLEREQVERLEGGSRLAWPPRGGGNSSESRKLVRASSSCLSRASLISFSCRRAGGVQTSQAE